MPVVVGQQAARVIPGARLALIQNAGHVPMLERPAEFAQLVTEFVAGR